MPVYNHDSIEAFTAYLKFEKRYSRYTVRSYGDDLKQFAAYLQEQFGMENPELGALTSALVRGWLARLKAEKQSAKTINRKLSSLKSFFKYHLRVGNIAQSPMKVIVAPKVPRRLPVYVEQEDMQTLFRDVEFPPTWKGATDRLLLSVFYHTGVRLSELQQLKESQVNAAANTLRILGKGNKERVIPVTDELVKALLFYMEEKRKVFEQPDRIYVFVTEKGKQLYAKYIYRTVNSYLGKVTTIGKKSPHVLRHTFATHLTANGAEINAVKELLGHSSLAATQIYTHNTIEKLREVYKKAHPKGE